MSQIEAKRRSTPQTIVTPPQAGDTESAWMFDGSILSLVGANVLAVGSAVYEGWNLYFLIIIYWTQSVIIGVSNFYRLRALEAMRTDKRKSASYSTFFALHYGLFHAVYLVFLLIFVFGDVFHIGSKNPLFDPLLWGCIAAFAANHYWSYRYNRELDLHEQVSADTLFTLPYFRIIPMHLTIIFGGMLGSLMASSVGLIFFGTLKGIADVCMHVYEHAKLRSARTNNARIKNEPQMP